jgi:hypothetical protein
LCCQHAVLPHGLLPALLSNSFVDLRPRRQIGRDSCAPLVLVVVGDLDELEGIAIGIAEVHPTPTGEHTLVDDVDRAENSIPLASSSAFAASMSSTRKAT